MTTGEFKKEMQLALNEYEKNKKRIVERYCLENSPYKIGDVFTDHIGSIRIEKIDFGTPSFSPYPCCLYYGVELKKDRTPKKSGSKRHAWQSNDISKVLAC